MQLNPFVEQRRAMKMMMFDMIKKDPTIQKKQIIGLFCLRTGVKKARAEEYWEELEDSGILVSTGIEQQREKQLEIK